MMKRPSSAHVHVRYALPRRTTEALGHLSTTGQIISRSACDPHEKSVEMLLILVQTPLHKWQIRALSLRSNAAHDTLSP